MFLVWNTTDPLLSQAFFENISWYFDYIDTFKNTKMSETKALDYINLDTKKKDAYIYLKTYYKNLLKNEKGKMSENLISILEESIKKIDSLVKLDSFNYNNNDRININKSKTLDFKIRE